MMGPANDDQDMMSEINVTPLVDVMLVLLIVFMVTAPLLVPQSLAVNLPKTDAVKSPSPEDDTQIVVLTSGVVEVDGLPMTNEALREFFASKVQDPKFRVRVHADENVIYGRLAEIMGMAQSAGVSRMAFATVANRSK